LLISAPYAALLRRVLKPAQESPHQPGAADASSPEQILTIVWLGSQNAGSGMSIFESLGSLLVPKDQLVPADALVVLDGGEFELRLAAGLSLLRRGYAPRLLVMQSSYHRAQHGRAQDAADEQPGEVFLLDCSAVSTAEEALEACPVLKRWACSSVMIVTSWYHTRRARTIFARRLKNEGVRVSIYPVAVPNAGVRGWWKSGKGRRTVVLETAKLLATWLHLGLPGAPDMRFRVKEWLHPSGAPPLGLPVLAGDVPQEALTSNFQAYLLHGQILRGVFGGGDSLGGIRSGRASPANTQPVLHWAEPQPSQNGVEPMQDKSFKAVNITAQEGRGHAALAEAFNAWAEKEQPASIVHVHYYHDEPNHLRGYQIIFEESAKAQERQLLAAEERRAA
jgi:uncharacterized SAM-binding protein YcdF (DUF218 family)